MKDASFILAFILFLVVLLWPMWYVPKPTWRNITIYMMMGAFCALLVMVTS